MNNNIEIVNFFNNDIDIEEFAKLYCITFIGVNYSSKDILCSIENIKKHSSYKGFKSLKALSNNRIVGFTYGYTSSSEQFYNQKIAEQLNNNEVEKWLVDCFEFTEMAIDINCRQLGIASKLHDHLLKGINHKTSILTTGHENYPAIKLYEKKGWQLIKSDSPVISKDNLQIIMGKKLI